jgi:predicted RNA-binding protein with PIN domain
MRVTSGRADRGSRGAWTGLGSSLGVLAAVVGFGLAWARVEAALLEPYPESPMDHRLRPVAEPSSWLVDGFNLLHAVVLGGRDRAEWWKESRRAEVVALAAGLSARGAEVWVVFDGPPERCGESLASGGVHQVFAPSADAWLLERVRASEEPERLAVVTADRALVSRLERCGARVVSPSSFAERCLEQEQAGG